MQRLDNEFMMRTSDAPLLKRKPSEYMREMYFTSQPMEMVDNREALELTFEMINADTQLLYSSDYPHWDMDLPSTIYDLPFLSERGQAQHPGRQRATPVRPRAGVVAGEARPAGGAEGGREDGARVVGATAVVARNAARSRGRPQGPPRTPRRASNPP